VRIRTPCASELYDEHGTPPCRYATAKYTGRQSTLATAVADPEDRATGRRGSEGYAPSGGTGG